MVRERAVTAVVCLAACGCGPTPAQVAGVQAVVGCPAAEVTSMNPPHPLFRAVGCGKTSDTFCAGTFSDTTCFALPMTIEAYVNWFVAIDMKRRGCSEFTVEKAFPSGGGFEFWDQKGCGLVIRHQCREDNGYPQCVGDQTLANGPPAAPSSSPPAKKPGKTKLVR